MKAVNGMLLKLAKRGDLALAVLLGLVVFLMIMPVPTVLVDCFIALNIAGAVTLLMVGVYIKSPLEFSSFPSVLLLSTLFRLALSITTTRLILLQANAGDIVYSFGSFVVAGNVVVGIVVFLIITIVQFVVITKGSERVAEVSARFSLDGMPGKQMSIDADLRSGVIDTDEAFRRRSALERQSQLYGSMDGAMKFVKGDAIAGLCIIIVNVVGGISIGVLQHGLPVSEALRIYTILTVGDGLVAQIPALFVAIAAGIVVTRVSSDASDSNLGADIGKQMLAQPDALLVAAITALGFAFLPGFPTLIFLLLASFLGCLGLSIKGALKRADAQLLTTSALKQGGAKTHLQGAPTSALSLLCSDADRCVFKTLDLARLNDALERIGQDYYNELGVPFPQVSIQFDSKLKPDRYALAVHGLPVAGGELVDSCVKLQGPVEIIRLLNIPSTPISRDNEITQHWIDQSYQSTLSAANIDCLTVSEALLQHIDEVARKHVHEFIGIQETRLLLDGLEKTAPDLVKEALSVVPIAKMASVLRRLINEGVSIRDLRGILELLVAGGSADKDAVMLTEYLRSQVASRLSYRYADADRKLWALLLTPELEDTIRESVRQTPQGSFLALKPEATRRLVASLQIAASRTLRPAIQPVLLTSTDLRRYISRLLVSENCFLPVLAFQELVADIEIVPTSTISGQ